MARIEFLSHSDMSIYFFRRPIMIALQQMGHEVFAIAPKGDFTSKLSEFNCVTYELDRASINPLIVMKNTRKLSEILAGLNLDLLQTSAHKSNVFGTYAAKQAGIKHVINLVEGLGSFYIDNDFKTKIVRFGIETLYKRALKMSDCCIFVNESDPKYFLSSGLIDASKVVKIKSVGVDTQKFDKNYVCAANLGDELSDKKIVLMIARAMWHKGVREFYEAAEILKYRTDCRFVYVGDGFDGNKSTADLKFLNSGNVLYLGARDDIPELLKASYILALPSYKEGFPRTILEAMAMSCAVVASDVAGCNEAVIDGVNGLLCEVKNSASLAAKIKILLDDKDFTRQLGCNGRDIAIREFDEKVVAQKYIEIYRKFIDV